MQLSLKDILHDFVLPPIGSVILKDGWIGPAYRGRQAAIFGIEPVPMALSWRTVPFHSVAYPTKC
jgi:hypothetical protein